MPDESEIEIIKSGSFQKLKNHVEGINLAMTKFENPEYRQNIIESLRRDDFSKKWRQIQARLNDIIDIKSFQAIASEIAIQYENLLNSINAPECGSFFEWLQSLPKKPDFGEEEREKLEKQIIRNYTALSPNFQTVFENLKNIEALIKFPRIRDSLIWNFVFNLLKIARATEDDDNAESVLIDLFANMKNIFDLVISSKWLLCDQVSFHEQFEFMSDNWPEKIEFTKLLYDLLDRKLHSQNLDNIFTELKSLDQDYQKTYKNLKQNPVDIKADFQDSEYIRRLWIVNLKLIDVKEKKSLSIDIILNDEIDKLNDVLKIGQRVFETIDKFGKPPYRDVEKFLADIPKRSSEQINRCLQHITTLCEKAKTERLAELKDLEQVESWLENRENDIKTIQDENDSVIKTMIAEIGKKMTLQRKNLRDLKKLGLKSTDTIQSTFEKCEEIEKHLKSAVSDFPKFIRNLNTLYNSLNDFQKKFKSMMSSKLKDEDMHLLEQLNRSEKIDILETLTEKYSSLQRLFQYGLIQIEIKPSQS